MTTPLWCLVVLLGLLVPSGVLGARAVHEVCDHDLDCPPKSACRPTSCDGMTCLCDSGHVGSANRTECLRAVRIGELCEPVTTRCISEYATCTSGICECLPGFTATKDGRCKLPGTNFIGESCGSCEFPAECISGVCKCAGEFRSLTTDEFWVDPISTLQCRPREYDLGKCNGTAILPDTRRPDPRDNQVLDPALAIDTDWSRILPEKSVYETCSSHSQCPGNSRCSPNSCDGFLCHCDIGFVASEDRLQCLPAVKTCDPRTDECLSPFAKCQMGVPVKTGEACDPRTDECLSPFAKCQMGVCTCMSFFTPTADGRCRRANNKYVGETCRSSEECEYPGTCNGGRCACVGHQRELTLNEFWIDPTLEIQCRPNAYSVWRCNGTVIDIPTPFQNEIPIDIEIELSYKKETKAHSDHSEVEINPTVVVEDKEDDDSFFVPLHIAGILAAALFALLIACIFKTKRRRAIKRDISLTRTNILANKSMSEEEMMTSKNSTLSLPAPSHSSNSAPLSAPAIQIPRPNVSIYNKNGWHINETMTDVKSVYDNQTDIYPDSNTTRSSGPFIVDANRNVHATNGTFVGTVSPYTIDVLKQGAGSPPQGPYLMDGQRSAPYMMDGQRAGPYIPAYQEQRGTNHYANESWQAECQSDNDIDLVMF